jgi:hypothetical protein
LYAQCAAAIGQLTVLNLKHTYINTYYIKRVHRGIWYDTDMQLGESARAKVRSLGKWRIRWKRRCKLAT